MSASLQPIDMTRLLWALAALAATTAPHLAHLPPWPVALMVAIVLWRLAVQRGHVALPGALVRFVLAVTGFAGVLLTFQTVSGLEGGSSLLVVMAALKLTETRYTRDLVVLALISYFLIATQFLFAQTVVTALYAIPEVWLVTTALLQVASPAPALPWRRAVARSGQLLAHALPLMLIAFLLFPRLSGPFWGMPRSDDTAITGLADTMSPGSISRLLQSDAVAFRARFDGPTPPSSERYWRGPVLSDFDGQTWSVFQTDDLRIRSSAIELQGAPYRYEITLEPHQERWLFALEQVGPVSLPPRTYLSKDRRLLRNRPVTRLFRYQLESWPRYRASPQLAPWELIRDTQFPDHLNPRTLDLARSWAATEGSSGQVIARALRHFREQPYIYTLTPPALNGSSTVDQFLFSSRRGFCEHYASAFSLLMRAAGIPARVVLGYQGGEVNPYTGHMTVRQSDAHAWTEVWLPDRGWLRVDPTAAVAPERVELGVQASVPDGETLPGLFRSYAWLSNLRFGWDALNNGWNEWVLGFSREKQVQVLQSLGMREPSLRKMLLTMIALGSAVLGALALYLLWQARPARGDRVARLYRRFCARAGRVCGPPRRGEGPLDFAARLVAARPDLAASANAITARYLALRYYPPTTAPIREFRRLVHAFRA